MKPVLVASEQKKFFRTQGFIAFEALLDEAARLLLLRQIAEREEHPPEVVPRYLLAARQEGAPLLRRVGTIAVALLDRKPLRIPEDRLLTDPSTLPSFREREVGFLLLPQTGEGLFFTHKELALPWMKEGKWYWFCHFTAHYVHSPLVIP